MPDESLRYCLGCRYTLLGLQSPNCPECGRAFDFENPATFGGFVPYDTKPARMAVLIAAGAILASAMCIAAAEMVAGGSRDFIVALAFWVVALAAGSVPLLVVILFVVDRKANEQWHQQRRI